jgi:hypothetical protein
MILSSGCGAILNGSDQRVRIVTVPPGAKVTVDGRELTSPAKVWLERDRDYTVIFEMNGFEPKQSELRSRRDKTGLMANCLCCLCIPQFWEAGTPSQYRLTPEELYVNLDPKGWSPR